MNDKAFYWIFMYGLLAVSISLLFISVSHFGFKAIIPFISGMIFSILIKELEGRKNES